VLSSDDGISQLFEIAMILWERIYLFKSGCWVDLDQLCKRVDYHGKPVFFSFDTDVSMFMNRDPEEVMGNMTDSLRTGRLVGMHVTEAESRDTLWSAEQIYQVMRTAIFNGSVYS
jgi:hypothetical protein